MTDVQTDHDLRAGQSSMCRRDQHALCAAASARCTCSCHGSRGQTPPRHIAPPTPIRKEPTMPDPDPAPAASAPVPTVTVELVKADLPAKHPSGRQAQVEAITALVPEMEAGAWYRVMTLPSTPKSVANGWQVFLRKQISECEWATRRIDADTIGLWGRKK